MKCCRDCYYSYSRSKYDLARNGHKEHSLECLFDIDKTRYKMPQECCEKFIERKKDENN